MAKKLIFLSKDICTTPDAVKMSIDTSILPTECAPRYDMSVEEYVSSLDNILVDLLHPVGSIYISVDPVDPMEIFGGIWEPYSTGRTLIGAGTYTEGSTTVTYTVESEGGEYSHTLTVDEIPAHRHRQYCAKKAYSGSKTYEYGGGTSGSYNALTAVGGGKAHNNVQPYIGVYIWKRIE